MDVTRLGLGRAALGRPAHITAGRGSDPRTGSSVEAMRDRAGEVLDVAQDAGHRSDVAAGPPLVVVAMWGLRCAGGWRRDAEVHETVDRSLAAFERQLAESRSLLHDHLAAYQVDSATRPALHWPTPSC